MLLGVPGREHGIRKASRKYTSSYVRGSPLAQVNHRMVSVVRHGDIHSGGAGESVRCTWTVVIDPKKSSIFGLLKKH